MNLVERFPNGDATLFQFNLHQWQPVYQDGHIVAVRVRARLLELLDDLNFVAADIGLIDQIDVLDTAIIEDEVKDVVIMYFAGLVCGTVAGPIQIGLNEALPFLICELNVIEGLQLNANIRQHGAR